MSSFKEMDPCMESFFNGMFKAKEPEEPLDPEIDEEEDDLFDDDDDYEDEPES